MKRIMKISAAVLSIGIAATLAGCSGCAGCSSKAKNTALTSSNWFIGTNYKGIQPSFIVDNDPDFTKEIINYDVTFVSPSIGNSSYSVDYKDGSYRTEFYATKYDWSSSSIPEDLRSDAVEILYYYRTDFQISVQFKTASGETSQWFDDSVTTECYFRAAGNNLEPVYSKQVINSTTPANYQAGNLASAYLPVNVTYENFYNIGCTSVISRTNGGDEKTYGLASKNSLFDNSSLYIAVRSMKLSSSLSQAIDLFSAAAGGVSTYTVSGTDAALTSEELTAVSSALQDKGLFTPTEDATGVSTVAVNVNYAGGDLQGTSQTVWYAALEDADNNTARCTMLKLSLPLSYNLGTLNFTLKDVESTLWNG